MVGSVGNGPAELGKQPGLPEELEPEVVEGRREIVLRRNLHASCFAVKESDADGELTEQREAAMAGVLARYRRCLVERMHQAPPR